MPICAEGHTSVGRRLLRRVRVTRWAKALPPPSPLRLPRRRRPVPRVGRRSAAASARRAATTRRCPRRPSPRRPPVPGSTRGVDRLGDGGPGVLRTRASPEVARTPSTSPSSSPSAESPCNTTRHSDRAAQPRSGCRTRHRPRPATRRPRCLHPARRAADPRRHAHDHRSGFDQRDQSQRQRETCWPMVQETPLTDGDRIHVGAWTTIKIEREF